MQAGVAQEPGRSRRLHRRCGTDGRDIQQSRPGERPTPAGANRAAEWYRQAMENYSAAGRASRSRSPLIVPMKSGNPPHGDPAEGSGGSDHGLSGGQTDWTPSQPPSQRKSGSQRSVVGNGGARVARFGVAMPWSEEPDARVGHVRNLWEPGVGNHRRPPGPSRFEIVHDPTRGDDKRGPYGPVSDRRPKRDGAVPLAATHTKYGPGLDRLSDMAIVAR